MDGDLTKLDLSILVLTYSGQKLSDLTVYTYIYMYTHTHAHPAVVPSDS